MFALDLNTQFSNLGDAVLARNLVAELRRVGRIEFCCSESGGDFLEFVGLGEEVPTGRLALAWKLVRSPGERAIVFLPGGVVADPSWRLALRWCARLGEAVVLHGLGILMIRVGYSWGIRSSSSRAEAAVRAAAGGWFRRLDLSLARDYPTAAWRSEGAIVMGDLALIDTDYLPDESSAVASAEGRGLVALSFRNPRSRNWVMDVLTEMSDEFGEVVQVAQVHGDAEIFLPGVPGVVWDGTRRGAAEIWQLYGACRFVFTDRLHVWLFAALCGAVPVLVGDYASSSKVYDYLETLALPVPAGIRPGEMSREALVQDLDRRACVDYRALLEVQGERSLAILRSSLGGLRDLKAMEGGV